MDKAKRTLRLFSHTGSKHFFKTKDGRHHEGWINYHSDEGSGTFRYVDSHDSPTRFPNGRKLAIDEIDLESLEFLHGNTGEVMNFLEWLRLRRQAKRAVG